MQPRSATLLLHPLMLFSIFTLLLNDFYLKQHFPNWFTGKLSDFAGLFAFSVFFFALLPQKKKSILIFVAVLFVFWKSDLSTPLINAINNAGLPIQRTIDYTDCIALTVLPFTLIISPVHYATVFIQRLALWCVSLVCLFAFSATSLPRRLADANRVQLDKYVHSKKSKAEIIKRLEADGLVLVSDSAIYERLWSKNYYLKIKGADGITRMVNADSISSGIYSKDSYGSIFTIPWMNIDGDSIQNLQLSIYELTPRRQEIRLHSFMYPNDSVRINTGYYQYKQFRRPIVRRIKRALK